MTDDQQQLVPHADTGQYRIRIADLRDIPALLEIEQAVFTSQWTYAEFHRVLDTPGVIALVVQDRAVSIPPHKYASPQGRNLIVAMGIGARVSNFTGGLWNLGVRPAYQRCGLGRWVLGSLESRLLGSAPKLHVDAVVVETNVHAHKFFRACGYRALRVVHQQFDDHDADCYYFRRTLYRQPPAPL